MGLDHTLGVKARSGNEDEIVLAQFRKFNALQGYMEREFDVQNCEDTVIPYTAIEHLNEVSKKILQSMNVELNEELLPTTEGFFYGSTNYNEWYYEDMRRLNEVTSNILEGFPSEHYEIIYWSWW